MYQYQFEKNARKNRRIARLLTVTFHALLIAAILYGNQSGWQDILPDSVQELLGMDLATTDDAIANLPKP